ncbi:hypothetical protein B9Z55_012913 [Caenorhabditis nigoni]|uniref:F-box domain-containing protein n=1 Tax=Caenorhabditis nigoni TaxID=1611254 RepID=A0A2G5TZF5_9PELO|nr:hypothetical protein B9Z55_012913 [Caenorhabditis nigoni]
MASDLENITGKAAKLSIEPIYDTNWSDMPDDIKLECIEQMELKEIMSLRCTAKAERSLVDSQKIKFTDGILCTNDECLVFILYHNKKSIVTKHSKDVTDGYESMKHIMKIGVFEKLIIAFTNPLANNVQFMTDEGLFTARNIEFNAWHSDKVIPVLRKMKNGVESIKINSTLSEELDQILALSHVQNVPYWHIQHYEQTDSLYMVAQMWIDTNSKIGSVFQVSVFGDGSFEEFLKHFDDRILSKSEKRVRIRTNNSDRHILMEFGTIQDFIYQYFRLMVISAEMEESEYDDNCKEWIFKMDQDVRYVNELLNIEGYDEYDDSDEFDELGNYRRNDNDGYWDSDD